MLVLPFVVFAFAAAVAALHRLVGEPLGAAATAELGELWRGMAMMLMVYTPAVARHQHALRVAAKYEALAQSALPPTLAQKEVLDVNPDNGPRRRAGPS